MFITAVKDSLLVPMNEVDSHSNKRLYVEYASRESGANFFGLMPDEKVGLKKML